VNGGGGVSGWVMTSSRRIPHPSYNDNSIMLTKVTFGCSYAEKSSKIIMLLFKLVIKTVLREWKLNGTMIFRKMP
jgi:hypothetical protein